MIKHSITQNTGLCVNSSTEGETIEAKWRRILNNKEPISDGAPLIYTERKNGVEPQYDIRTDRWEVAVDATTKIEKSYMARREERNKPLESDKPTEGSKDGGAEPIATPNE